MSGRTADIPLIVRVPDEPGENLQANLTVTSNGNQKFIVPVRLSVTPGRGHRPAPVPSPMVPARAAAAVPAATLPYSIPPAPMARSTQGISSTATAQPMPAAVPVTEALDDSPDLRKGGLPSWLPFIPVAFMALALLGTVTRDLVTAAPKNEEKPPEEFADVPSRPARELIRVGFHDRAEEVSLGEGGEKSDRTNEKDRKPGLWKPSMRFGLVTVGGSGAEKKLTYAASGLTNNVCVRLDGKDLLWGESPVVLKTGELVGETYGEWRERKIDLGKDKRDRPRQGCESVWVFDKYKVVVTQHIEVIIGQSGDLDTCLVQYRIENEDNVQHAVGLRFLLDTFIGDNDGVPFLIPGHEELINTNFEFNKASEVPDFLQARESEDLTKPGTVAQVGLKLEGLEHPDRVTLGAYPNPDLRRIDSRCDQWMTKWEVPVLSIKTIQQVRENAPPDSAVTIYWNEKPLGPGKSRTVGFTYGLGQVAGGEGGGKLALTAGGSFIPGGEISVTAYVVNPQKDQTVTLKLPEGFEFIEGDKTRRVPPAGEASRISPVTWKIRAPRKTDEFKLEAETSNQLKQSHTITIRPKRIFGS